MQRIWSEETYIRNMVAVELAHLKHNHPDAERAFLPDGPGKPSLATRVHTEEQRTGHEVTALLAILDEELGHSLCHAGLTSSDVTDTARAMQMREAHARLIDAARKLTKHLDEVAFEHAATPIIARTHGQYAVPSTLGHRLSVWSLLIRTSGYEVEHSISSIRGKMSGAVGTHVFSKKFEEAGITSELSIPAATYSSQIVPRTYWLRAWNAVLGLTVACEKIAGDLRVLTASGIEEFATSAPEHSSSTMVHKRNPASIERIMGLARMTRHLHHALTESVGDNWLERDLTNTSVERIALPQFYSYAESIINGLITTLENGFWNQYQMGINLSEAIGKGGLDEYGYVKGLLIELPRDVARTSKCIGDFDTVRDNYTEAAADDVRRGRPS